MTTLSVASPVDFERSADVAYATVRRSNTLREGRWMLVAAPVVSVLICFGTGITILAARTVPSPIVWTIAFCLIAWPMPAVLRPFKLAWIRRGRDAEDEITRSGRRVSVRASARDHSHIQASIPEAGVAFEPIAIRYHLVNLDDTALKRQDPDVWSGLTAFALCALLAAMFIVAGQLGLPRPWWFVALFAFNMLAHGTRFLNSVLNPTLLRISPGRMEILQAALWRDELVVLKTVDLRSAVVVFDFEAAVALIRERDDESILMLELDAFRFPRRFAGAVVAAATSRTQSPALPTDSLLG